jgi:hypothetical protein
MNNYVNPVEMRVGKSLEELQGESRKRNLAEADRLCKNICLCIGWSFVLMMLFYLIITIFIITLFDTQGCPGDKRCNEFMIIEDYYSGSAGN